MISRFHLQYFAVCLALLFVDVVALRAHKLEKGLKCERQFNCGKILANLGYPFQVEDEPQGCGAQNRIQLSCEHNRTVLYLGPNSNKYYVAEDSFIIKYNRIKVRVIDPGLKKNNCSTLPLYSFTPDYPLRPTKPTVSLIFVNCRKPIKSPFYVDTAPCVTKPNTYSYVVVGEARDLVASDIEETCTVCRIIYAGLYDQYFRDRRKGNISFTDIHDALAFGFELEWRSYKVCSKKSISECLKLFVLPAGEVGVTIILARAVVGIILFAIFLLYRWKRRHLSTYNVIEEFLQSRNNLIPIRYSYKEIKKMTNNFKEKLGEGGYGSVYKGKSRSGQIVAIKMLIKSKANGQDFINEVASLGRIHHVNVVQLVGFCVTSSKRALVYDYMQNGSLDKVIFAESPNGTTPLCWKKAVEIVTGVARGIEYLHQGCNMQILHFDIKPHNILLDENFVPKVSDFGLAKLRPSKESSMTLTAIRGTLGYMAPELFYKKIGKVSYKADVYSFGMLLMEMVGRRRNVNAHAEHSSQIYFPSWIYDRFKQEGDIEIGDHLAEEEKEIARKLILIALWCIQMTPSDRPSMRDVLQMLESDPEDLLLPPKPTFHPSDSPVVLEQRSNHSSSEISQSTLWRSEISEIDQTN